MHTEVEKKYLIGSDINKVEEVKTKLSSLGFTKVGEESQLNHYFKLLAPSRTTTALYQMPMKPVGKTELEFHNELARHMLNSNVSVRTRYTKGKLPLLCIKSSKGDASNGDSRLESDIPYSTMAGKVNDHSNGELYLDNVLLKRGFEFQAKWSRDREIWKSGDITVCIDKNAGYGYLVEIEMITESEDNNECISNDIDSLAKNLNLKELSKDTLNIMFEFYNQNWKDYYGTDKIFEIK